MPKAIREHLSRETIPPVIRTTTSCAQYQNMMMRFESSRKRYDQFRAKRNTQMAGLFAERARKIHREEKANMSVLTQQMQEHRETCAICKVLSAGRPIH